MSSAVSQSDLSYSAVRQSWVPRASFVYDQGCSQFSPLTQSKTLQGAQESEETKQEQVSPNDGLQEILDELGVDLENYNRKGKASPFLTVDDQVNFTPDSNSLSPARPPQQQIHKPKLTTNNI